MENHDDAFIWSQAADEAEGLVTVEKGFERIRVTQRSRRLPSSDCCIVGDILGVGSLTKDQAGESVGPVKRP